LPLPSRFVREALSEFQEQIDRYAAVDPELADRFVDAIETEVQLVCDHPDAAPLLLAGYRRRVVRKRFAYSAIYIVEDNTVVVAAVWADRRNPELLRQRLRQRATGA
jgi:plasmid stabilization system protein ParE